MPCGLTSSRSKPCLDAIAGIKNFYLVDFDETYFTVSGGEVTAIDAALTTIYKYALHDADGNTFDEQSATDQNTGVTTYEQSGAAVLTKLDLATSNELLIAAHAKPYIVWEHRNGDLKLQGLTDGCIVTVQQQSGGAKTDFNGYNITTTSTEVAPAPIFDSAAKTAFLALGTGTQITP